MPFIHELIPIVAIISFWVAVISIVVAALLISLQRRRHLSNEILAAIEKGIDVPLPRQKERNYVHLGLIFTLVGVVFALAMWVSAGYIGFLWGLLPFGLGIAFLLIAKSEKKKED